MPSLVLTTPPSKLFDVEKGKYFEAYYSQILSLHLDNHLSGGLLLLLL